MSLGVITSKQNRNNKVSSGSIQGHHHQKNNKKSKAIDTSAGKVMLMFFFDQDDPQMSGRFRPQGPRISFGHHYHHHHQSSFIMGANDLRCWCALKPQIYIQDGPLLIDFLQCGIKVNAHHYLETLTILHQVIKS